MLILTMHRCEGCDSIECSEPNKNDSAYKLNHWFNIDYRAKGGGTRTFQICPNCVDKIESVCPRVGRAMREDASTRC